MDGGGGSVSPLQSIAPIVITTTTIPITAPTLTVGFANSPSPLCFAGGLGPKSVGTSPVKSSVPSMFSSIISSLPKGESGPYHYAVVRKQKYWSIGDFIYGNTIGR